MVQTWVSSKISSYISKKINTTVSLQGVDISIFDHFIFEKLYIADQKKDTLFYFDKFALDIDKISLSKQFIFLDAIKLNHFIANIYSDSLGKANYRFIIDQFNSETTDTTTSGVNWKISCKKIAIEDSHFSYYVPDTVNVDFGINYSDLDMHDFNLYAKNLLLAGNSATIDIDSMSIKDKSGFKIKKLKSNAFVSNRRIELNRFTILTKNSNLYFKKLKFSYPDFSAFRNFLTEIDMNVQIADSTVLSLTDLSYFVSSLKGYKQKLKIYADIRGTVDQLNAKIIDIKLGKGTRLKTNFKLNGLSDFNKLKYSIKLDSLTTSISDINSIRNPADTTKSVLSVPDNLKHIGKLYFSGKLKGSMQDVHINGDLITGIGNLNSDIQITEKAETQSYNIKGSLIGKKLLISNIIENKDIGTFDIADTLDIAISKKGAVEGWSKGLVSNMRLYNYSYDSIRYNLLMMPDSYRGNIKIDDKNIKLTMAGNYIVKDSIPAIMFVADLSKFFPYKLNLVDDSLLNASVNLTGNIRGIDPDKVTGKLECKIHSFQNLNNKLKSEKILVSINNRNEDTSRIIKVYSDFFDLDLNGKLDIKNIGSSVDKFICRYVPSIVDTVGLKAECEDTLNADNPDKTDLAFSFKAGNINKLLGLFAPETEIAKGTVLSGNINFAPEKFHLEGYSPEIIAEDTKLNKIILNGDNYNNQLSFYVNSKNIFWNESNSLDNSLLQIIAKTDSVYLDFMWDSFHDTLNYNGNFSLIAGIENRLNAAPIYKIKLKPSDFTILKNKWKIKSNEIIIDTNYIDLGQIDARNNFNDHFIVKGIISDKVKDTLELDVNKFDMKILNLLFQETGVKIAGMLSGNTKIISTLGDFQINSEDSIQGVKINNEDIGKIYLKADWDNNNYILSVNANTQLKNTKNLLLSGDYKIKKDLLDFKIDATMFPFKVVQPFLSDYLTDLNGKISGDVTITGSAKKPNIKAGLKFVKAGFKAIYTQTYYSFTDSLFIERGNIRFKKMKLNAGKNSYALVSGDISHDHFKDIKLDISLDAHNFLFLNTKQTDTSLFYGTVFATGGIKLDGGIDDLNIDIKLKTGNGTKFFLPLTTNSEATQNEFISFKTLDTAKIVQTKQKQVDVSGMNINFDLKITPDAILQIIMDETGGDIIKSQGNGALNIKVDKSGDLFIYGLYTVYKGSYLFTLQNLINKKFLLEKGSTIRWYGDPLNAELDMNAVYKINKVSAYDLMVDPEYRDIRTDVNCNLLMNGSLEKPIIEFGLDVPNAKEPIPSNLSSLTQDELNKQILSLLITKKFRPLPGLESSVSSGAVISTNAFEMLSNQLSNWLSQISDDFDIGVNYTQGDQGTTDELEVALSTQLFNNRVSINTNVGVGGVNSTSQSEQNATNKIVGDVEVEVKLNKKGSLKGKFFNRSNKSTEQDYNQTLYTQGVGVLYRKEFNTFGELLNNIWSSLSFKNKREEKKKKKNKKSDIERKEPETKSISE